MTAEEVEVLARNVAGGMLSGSERSLYVHSSLALAHFILDALPVIKAASALHNTWDGPCAVRDGVSFDEEVDRAREFIAAIDAFNAKAGK
jgi:hypothetical protein